MTDNTEPPFWKRPLPPIKVAAHVNGDDPLADLSDERVADAKHSTDPLVHEVACTADPLADIDPLAEPLANASVSLPDAVATLSVAELQQQRVESMMRCQRATDAQRECRGRVALALQQFQRATMQTQTQEQMIRQHIESENKLRADRAAGKISPRGGQRRLGSAIDTTAYYSRNAGRGAGGGNAFRRGASPASRRTPPPQSAPALKAFPGSGLPPITGD